VVAGAGILLDGSHRLPLDVGIWPDDHAANGGPLPGRPDDEQDAFLTSIAEWIGFSAILFVLFCAPRIGRAPGTPGTDMT
jgi:hypothetical protein